MKELYKEEGTVEHFLNTDFSNHRELNKLVKIAAEICETPIALLTFIKNDHQYFKVRFGTEEVDNELRHSFCQFLFNSRCFLQVTDVKSEPSFSQLHPVKNHSSIQFYAGVPLIADYGKILGSLCVMSSEPQQLSDEQQKMLIFLSQQAYRLMELELNNQLWQQHSIEQQGQQQKLIDSSNKLKAIFESSPDCFVLLNHKFRVLAYNQALAKFVKKERKVEMKINMAAAEYLHPNLIDVVDKYGKKALLRGKPSSKTVNLSYKNRQIWWRLDFNPSYDNQGNLIGVTINGKDISEQKLYEQKVLEQNEYLRKMALLQSHEIRRPLANILGLIELIKLQEDHEELVDKLHESARQLDEILNSTINFTGQE